ncbi:IS66 family transposase [Ruegeria halocynthiae]|uniref:IS66 family transposase n=1 Tax=Ruegeria halocynthiae TaxID=985054 RepID=UPI0013637CF6|nr:transposase [Ruegeria halocynthiae]
MLYKHDGETWGWSPDKRRQYRQTHCKPVVDKLLRRMEEIQTTISTGSRLNTAINYVLKRRESLTRFLEDGRAELDTNAVERQFKSVQMLRKNVYFMGSDEGGETWAIFSSLIETCKLNGYDPYRYLVWLFDELSVLFARGASPVIDYRKYLPWNAPEQCKAGMKQEDEDVPQAA